MGDGERDSRTDCIGVGNGGLFKQSDFFLNELDELVPAWLGAAGLECCLLSLPFVLGKNLVVSLVDSFMNEDEELFMLLLLLLW